MKSLIVNPPHNFEMVEKEMPKATDGRVVKSDRSHVVL